MSGDKKTSTSGNSSTNSTSHVTGTSTSGPEEWAKLAGIQIYNQGASQAANPWTAYQGDRVADYGDDLSQAENIIRSLGGTSSAQGASREALDSVRNAIDPTATVADRMNPFTDAVLNPQLRKINAQAGMQRNALDSQATLAGALGSSSQGIAKALLARDAGRATSDATNQVYGQAFDRAQAQKNAELQMLGNLSAGYNAIDAAATSKAGTLANYLTQFAEKRKGVDQAKANVGYTDFLEQRDWDKKNTTWLAQLLNSVPKGQVSTTDQTNQTNSQTNSYSESRQPDNTLEQILGQLGGTLLSGGMAALTGGGSLMAGGMGGMGGLFGGNMGSSLFGASSAFLPSFAGSNLDLSKGDDSDWV